MHEVNTDHAEHIFEAGLQCGASLPQVVEALRDLNFGGVFAPLRELTGQQLHKLVLQVLATERPTFCESNKKRLVLTPKTEEEGARMEGNAT